MVNQRHASRVLPRIGRLGVTRHRVCALAPACKCTSSGSALMPKAQAEKSYSALTVVDVAELLGVSDRGVRKWIKEKGLPAKSDPRGFALDWPLVLQWYVDYRIAENPGTGGTKRGENGIEEPLETFDEAMARKTRAEADLKELQLARERGEVAAIADVERVLAGANKAIQTLILALPSSLTPQLIGLGDRIKVFEVIDRAVRATLGNLASIDAVRQARTAAGDEDE
jgi:phage terminase Nu1 subunit (DNA packaging protein)